MHPDLMFRRQLRNAAQRVDSPGIRGTCGGDDRQDLLAIGLGLRQFFGQIVQIHTCELIGFHQRHGLVTQAE
ncbi:hypothetical protein D3C71_1963110 [compost metagenome]